MSAASNRSDTASNGNRYVVKSDCPIASVVPIVVAFDAIAFNLLQGRPGLRGTGGKLALPQSVHLVYRLDVNEWNGERRLQLLVDHLLE